MGNLQYQLKQIPDSHKLVNLLYVTFSKFEGDWPSLSHSHYFTELFYVREGSGEFRIENASFPIQKDDLIIINPNILHTEVSLGSPPLEYITLGVEGLSFSFNNNQDYMTFNCKKHKNDFLFYFSSMLTELEEKKEGYLDVCQDMLEILTIRLQRITNSAFEIMVSQPPNRECAKIKRYIDFNYQDNISLDSLAEMAHLNKYYFVHVFTKCYGLSSITYLNERRIEVSKELLRSTDHCIADIAHLSGFSSQSYFAQSFKKSCNMTAGAYRKMIKRTQKEATGS